MDTCVDGPGALTAFAMLGARANAAGLSLRLPPLFPTTCCGRGCSGCVWEGFYAAANCWCDDAEDALQAVLNQ